MKYLGIDYGRRRLGLAVSDGILAEPLEMSNVKCQMSNVKCGEDGQIRTMIGIINEIRPEEIIIGVSEGEMAKETKRFGRLLEKETKLPVVFWDETLTTKEAARKMIEGGMAKKRRKRMNNPAAAALILQSYLEMINEKSCLPAGR